MNGLNEVIDAFVTLNTLLEVPKSVRDEAKLEYLETKLKLQKDGLPVPFDLAKTIAAKWIIKARLANSN